MHVPVIWSSGDRGVSHGQDPVGGAVFLSPTHGGGSTTLKNAHDKISVTRSEVPHGQGLWLSSLPRTSPVAGT